MSAIDPLAFLTAAAALLAVGTVAAFIPAWRAGMADPLPALREHLGCSTLDLVAWIDGVQRVPESILYGLADLILDAEIMAAGTSCTAPKTPRLELESGSK